MPRLGPALAAIALCVAACDQRAAPASGSSSAAPVSAAPVSTAQPPDSAAPPGFTGAPYAASRTYFKLQGRYPPAWTLCDGVDRPQAIVAGLPDADHNLAVFTLDKRTGAHASRTLKLGEPDPGAGNIYWPLNETAGAEAGYLRAINPGVLDDPKAAATATFTSVKLGEEITACRWAANTRVQAIGQRRSYLVTSEAGQLVYRTFNYADAVQPIQGPAGMISKPSLEIRGGQETRTATGVLFAFENQGYRYTVEIDTGEEHRGAVMAVKAGHQVSAEPFEAYTYAP
jgi:hypothetical protein